MNEHSSRSHMMLTVSIVSESVVTGQTTRGKLNLVSHYSFVLRMSNMLSIDTRIFLS
jgi:hypothetical protein